ncbi:deaminase/reductase [Devosia limi DSM 17137]|uniref:Deaminase/reductase n=1 Tax=Devosia limi DSM 17137 TaxID=1121477 RepID=A0A0F5L529_9HYPH|nr:dihydrofolate reductase family protein [Devosia limi]KKB77309.1 deaminase/reductase [Devosia limi DSM 17137]SHE65593.1 Dihydrofolate reductase [Devosia limi DSM 17137]
MKLKTTTNLTLDGVMQGLGGAEEDRSGGFERGGWAIPIIDPVGMQYLDEAYGGAGAFLFGRRTYDIFARSWGKFEDTSTSAIAAALNSRPKYVVSSTLTDPQWAGTSVLSGDVANAIRNLKVQNEGTLLVPGSGKLVRWLLAHDLVDQLDVVIYPVVIGQGTRLFPETGPDIALELLSSHTSPGGLTMQSYQPKGRPHYQTDTLDTDKMSEVGRGRSQA